MAIKPRAQTRDPNAGGIALRPQARVVDNFRLSTAQAPNEPDQFAQLAGALKELNPTINNFLKKEKKENDDASVAEGVKLFNENKKGFAEAVRSGLIPAGANPHLQRGYRLSELKLKGHDYSTRLQTAWAGSEARNQNDPDVYQKFVQDFTADYSKTHLAGFDPTEVLSAFQPAVDRTQSVLQSQHTAYRIGENERIAMENVGMLTQANLEALGGQALDHSSPEGKQAISQTGAALTQDARELMSQGISGKKASAQILKSTIATAIERNDIGMLAVLDHVKTGTGVLSKTADARKAISAAKTAINAEHRARENFAYTERERKAKKLGDRIIGTALDALLANPDPSNPVFKTQLDHAIKLSQLGLMPSSVASNLIALRTGVFNENAKIRERPESVTNLYAAIAALPPDGDGHMLILQAALDRKITAGTASAATKFWQSSKKHAGIFNSDEFKETSKRLTEVITSTSVFGKLASKSQLFKAHKARVMLRSTMAEWADANPEEAKSSIARLEQSTFLFEKITKNPAFGVHEPAVAILNDGVAARVELINEPVELGEFWKEQQALSGTPEQWAVSPIRKAIVERAKVLNGVFE